MISSVGANAKATVFFYRRGFADIDVPKTNLKFSSIQLALYEINISKALH